MMKITVLGSGSKGNATLVRTEATCLLIDAGLGIRQLEQRLRDTGTAPEDVQAVFLTHEHGDHAAGLSRFTTRYHVPVYLSKRLIARRKEISVLKGIQGLCPIERGSVTELGNLKIKAFPVLHDTVDPLGFSLENNGAKFAYVTDLGFVTPEVIENLKEADALVVEFNHDVTMLKEGEYPEWLKERVLGNQGHISNEQAGQLLSEVVDGRCQHIFLAHLSENNNTPGLALEAARRALETATSEPSVNVAPQHETSQTITIEAS